MKLNHRRHISSLDEPIIELFEFEDDNESIVDEALLLPIKLFETPSFSVEYKNNFKITTPNCKNNSFAEISTKSTPSIRPEIPKLDFSKLNLERKK